MDDKLIVIVFISSLLILGNGIALLKSQIHGSLHVGCTKDEF